jgi:hypothetical protein
MSGFCAEADSSDIDFGESKARRRSSHSNEIFRRTVNGRTINHPKVLDVEFLAAVNSNRSIKLVPSMIRWFLPVACCFSCFSLEIFSTERGFVG